MHALIQNKQITQVSPLPRIWWDGDRWHDLRDDDGTSAAELGWLPVTTQPRPADTATTTWDRADPALVNGQPVVSWTERPWTEDEQAAEAEQNARLDDLAERVARIEAHLWPAPPDPTTPDDPTVTDWQGVWPDGGLLRDGGTVWRNVSGVPLTTPPSGFPGQPSQWGHLFVAVLTPEPAPEPDVRSPWATDVSYVTGNEVTHDGRAWRAKIDHISHAGWAPSAATHAVWEDIGPA